MNNIFYLKHLEECQEHIKELIILSQYFQIGETNGLKEKLSLIKVF